MSIEAPSETIVELRRAIHQAPELSNQEHATQALVRKILEDNGLQGVEDVADTGLFVDIVGNAGTGPTVGLRADMDALPIQEATELAFASQNAGVMHACGHDAHTAILVGSCLMLNENRNAFRGRVRCVFQPAEEAEPLGGRRIVESGILRDVKGIFALHVDPDIDAGIIGVRDGALLAGGQEFRVTVHGRASHAARPHLSVDAVVVGSAIVQALQTIRSRFIDPLQPCVLTIGKFHSGTARNVIAESAVIEGTLRVLDETVRDRMLEGMRQVCEHTAKAHGASVTFDTSAGEPVLVNDEYLTDIVRRSGKRMLGEDCVLEVAKPSMGSEDFAFYVQAAPVTMFRLGVRNQSMGYVHPVHNPLFAIDEQALTVGAKVMVTSALEFLAEAEAEGTG